MPLLRQPQLNTTARKTTLFSIIANLLHFVMTIVEPPYNPPDDLERNRRRRIIWSNDHRRPTSHTALASSPDQSSAQSTTATRSPRLRPLAQADDGALDQTAQPACWSRSLTRGRSATVRFIHRDRPFARARSRSVPSPVRKARCGRSQANRRGRTFRVLRTRSVRPTGLSCRHRGCGG
jgi:hypothetical protein